MKLLLVLFYLLGLIYCSSFIQEEDNISQNLECLTMVADGSRLESVSKQYFLTVEEENVVFKTTPFDYKIDLAKPEFAVAFNDYFGCVKESQLEFFLRVYLKMFSQLFPGLENVPIHQHDISGLIVFGLLHLLSEEIPSDSLQFREVISELLSNFDPSSVVLKVFTSNLRSTPVLIKKYALDLLFKLAIDNNCYYTAEAFFVTGMKNINREIFIKSIEISECSGDLRFLSRVASAQETSDRFEVSIQVSDRPFWPQFNQIKSGLPKIAFGARMERELEFTSIFSIPSSQDSDSLCSYAVSGLIEEVKSIFNIFRLLNSF
jgi:hypothetical protein